MKLTLYNMDVLAGLSRIASDSVDCIVTSPPYYGLRSYKGAETMWDAKAECKHEFSEPHKDHEYTGGISPNYTAQFASNKTHFSSSSSSCIKCGAWKGQLGLEPTYQLYLSHLMQITAELKRVLKPTGTMWWNCGDTYSGNKEGKKDKKVSDYVLEEQEGIHKTTQEGINEKSRMMLPERFAMKLIDEQAWTLRNDICWSKPNHMPSSVKDRLSNGWEHIYLFTKAKRYYFNLDAIREKHQYPADVIRRIAQDAQASVQPFAKGSDAARHIKHDEAVARHGSYNDPLHFKPLNIAGKNPGDVWTITTRPYKEAHFATFPPALPERCIKAGCPDEVCSKCGKPKIPISEPSEEYAKLLKANKTNGNNSIDWFPRVDNEVKSGPQQRVSASYRIIGYGPTCSCSASFAAGTVLDPFAGSGTTLMTAMQQRKNAIGIEIKPDYCKLIEKRCKVPGNLAYDYELIKAELPPIKEIA